MLDDTGPNEQSAIRVPLNAESVRRRESFSAVSRFGDVLKCDVDGALWSMANGRYRSRLSWFVGCE
jgi:hypothetical protein